MTDISQQTLVFCCKIKFKIEVATSARAETLQKCVHNLTNVWGLVELENQVETGIDFKPDSLTPALKKIAVGWHSTQPAALIAGK